MKRMRKKLNDPTGASILFAILVFMLCILAGTAAVTAASANSGRYSHQRADQQRYLSVASAVRLLTGELTNNTFKGKVRITETKPTGEACEDTAPKVEKVEEEDEEEKLGLSGDLKALLEDYFKNLYYSEMGVKDDAAPASEAAGTFSSTVTIEADNMDIVTVKVEADRYNVTLTLWAGTESEKAYTTVVRLMAVEEPSSGPVTKEYSGDTWTTTWDELITVRWPEENVVVTAMSTEESESEPGGGI